MKRMLANTMFTTGASLIILTVFWLFIGEKVFALVHIFETIGANVVINFGLFLRNKFEIKNVILEYMVDVSYVIIVLIVFSLIFNWELTPIWFLVAMAVGIYAFLVITTVAKINRDTKEINELLEKRREM